MALPAGVVKRKFEGGVASCPVEERFPRPRQRAPVHALSTSFVLAALRALQVDSSCVSGADGWDRGKPTSCSAPAGRVVAGVVADQRVGDAGGAVRQGASDNPAGLAA